MYQYRRIHFWNIAGLLKVTAILHRCGKDMAKKYNVHHWDNSFIKNLAIVALCVLKNQIWLVYDKKQAVATFQTKKTSQGFFVKKLGTEPECSGRGIGSFCMQTVESMAQAVGCNRVYFEVYDKSRHAISFYVQKGYTVCGQVSTRKYTEIIMEKLLGEEV